MHFLFYNVSLLAWREEAQSWSRIWTIAMPMCSRRTQIHRFSKARVELELQPFVRSATSIKELVCTHAVQLQHSCSAVETERRDIPSKWDINLQIHAKDGVYYAINYCPLLGTGSICIGFLACRLSEGVGGGWHLSLSCQCGGGGEKKKKLNVHGFQTLILNLKSLLFNQILFLLFSFFL